MDFNLRKNEGHGSSYLFDWAKACPYPRPRPHPHPRSRMHVHMRTHTHMHVHMRMHVCMCMATLPDESAASPSLTVLSAHTRAHLLQARLPVLEDTRFWERHLGSDALCTMWFMSLAATLMECAAVGIVSHGKCSKYAHCRLADGVSSETPVGRASAAE